MQYIKGSSDLMIAWYDAMNTTGSVGYQNQLDDLNAPFLQEGDTSTSDGMFLNYGWNGTLLANSTVKRWTSGEILMTSMPVSMSSLTATTPA